MDLYTFSIYLIILSFLFATLVFYNSLSSNKRTREFGWDSSSMPKIELDK